MRQKRMGALLALAVVLAGILGVAVPAAAASSAPAPARTVTFSARQPVKMVTGMPSSSTG